MIIRWRQGHTNRQKVKRISNQANKQNRNNVRQGKVMEKWQWSTLYSVFSITLSISDAALVRSGRNSHGDNNVDSTCAGKALRLFRWCEIWEVDTWNLVTTPHDASSWNKCVSIRWKVGTFWCSSLDRPDSENIWARWTSEQENDSESTQVHVRRTWPEICSAVLVGDAEQPNEMRDILDRSWIGNPVGDTQNARNGFKRYDWFSDVCTWVNLAQLFSITVFLTTDWWRFRARFQTFNQHLFCLLLWLIICSRKMNWTKWRTNQTCRFRSDYDAANGVKLFSSSPPSCFGVFLPDEWSRFSLLSLVW